MQNEDAAKVQCILKLTKAQKSTICRVLKEQNGDVNKAFLKLMGLNLNTAPRNTAKMDEEVSVGANDEFLYVCNQAARKLGNL